MASVHQQLSEQFYKWESRGRGWQIFDEPVFPEPPFQPFVGNYLPEAPAMDDGRSPTLLSSLFRKISQRPVPPIIAEVEEEPESQILIRDPLVELQASLPADFNITREAFEQFLSNLSLCREPVAFEILGLPDRVALQFAAHPDDAPLIRRQLQAHFPEGMFHQREGILAQAWDNCEGEDALAVEFGLAREFMLPLASSKLDPFIGIIGALSALQPGELGLFQVLFQPVRNNWAENIVRSVTHADGKPFFVNQPELAGAAENKVARPLFAAVVRIAVRTEAFDRTLQIARDLAGSLRVFAHPQGNELIPLENSDYPFEEHVEDVVRRQSRRSGMLLNSDELIGFVHLPSSAVRSPILLRETGKTKAAPSIVRQPQGVLVGDNEHGIESVPVYLSPDQRVRHTHIIGSSGTGKSSLLLSLIRQDIEKGEGVAVLDPHGDLIDQILGIIPAHRINDVVLVNPSDVEFPIGFNILQAHSEEEKNLLSSDLIAVFRRLSTSWGDQMDAVLQNAILAFLESSRGGTLADLRRFLLESPFRSDFLQTVQDPEIIYYWQKVFPQLSGGKSIGPVLTRLQDFFSRKPLRNMVSQPENKLDFGVMMDTGKIFLAKLSEGLLGKENSYLLGTILMSKFQQLAMARQAQNVAARRDFWIYIDEFHNFITPSMAEILQGARKYRIGLTLAHHELRQLQREAEVASAVMTHPCTRIAFQVGDDDAKRLGECFESFDAKSLKTLEKFHAIARVERNDFDFNLSFRKPELPSKEQADRRKNEVIAASRTKYAIPRAQVEAALLASIRDVAKPSEPPPKPPPQPRRPASPPSLPKDSEPKPAEVPKATVSEKENSAVSVSPPDKPEVPTPNGTAATDVQKEPRTPAELGRGGEQHQALQQRLKEIAEAAGYRAVTEKPILDGAGSVDVALEKDGMTVAVEVTVTTSIDQEISNLRKRLKAGFSRYVLVCESKLRLQRFQLAIQGEFGEDVKRIHCCFPNDFAAWLGGLQTGTIDQPVKTAADAKMSKGYNTKIAFAKVSPEERKHREEAAYKLLLKDMRREKP